LTIRRRTEGVSNSETGEGEWRTVLSTCLPPYRILWDIGQHRSVIDQQWNGNSNGKRETDGKRFVTNCSLCNPSA